MPCCGPRECADFSDDELPADADIDRFGGDGIRCPSCGSEVYFDAPQCSTCGVVLSDDILARKHPVWVPITAVLVIIGFLLWAVL